MRQIAPQPSASPLGAPATESVYLTADEVAALLRCSSKHIYRLVREDPTLPALWLGNVLRFRRVALMRWLESREQGRGRIRGQVRMLKKSKASASSAGPCAEPCATGGAEAAGKAP